MGVRNGKTTECVMCGKPMDPMFRPFCSKRCADVDLNRWLSGGYVVPGAALEDDGQASLGSDDDREGEA